MSLKLCPNPSHMCTAHVQYGRCTCGRCFCSASTNAQAKMPAAALVLAVVVCKLEPEVFSMGTAHEAAAFVTRRQKCKLERQRNLRWQSSLISRPN